MTIDKVRQSIIDRQAEVDQMKKADAIKFFRSEYAIAKKLKLTKQAVHQWPDVIPFRRAIKLEELSGGKLKVNHDLYST